MIVFIRFGRPLVTLNPLLKGANDDRYIGVSANKSDRFRHHCRPGSVRRIVFTYG